MLKTKMQTVVLNGFSCGIACSKEVAADTVEQERLQMVKDGFICWITRPDRLGNQQSLGGEYNKSNPSQLA